MTRYHDQSTEVWVESLPTANGVPVVSVNSITAGVQVGEFTSYGSATLAATASSTADTDDVHRATTLAIKITGLTGDTVSVSTILDEAKTLLTAAMRPIDLATGALAAASTLGNGSYLFSNLDARFVRFTKSGGAETPVVTYLARG